jgi:hypothetical protein
MAEECRSMTVDVFVDKEQIQAIRDSIARYRAGCRQLFAVLGLAQAAGAAIGGDEDQLRITPGNDRAKLILAASLDSAAIERGDKEKGEGQAWTVKVGAGAAYELREYFRAQLYPTALSFVWDSARRQVWNRWTAKDPEFTRAGRGWLVLQGARGLAWFRGVGIEFPQATARPKLHGRSATLKWDSELGPIVLDLLKRSDGRGLDPGRWYIWKQVRDGEWKAGTVILNERDGRLRLSVSYYPELGAKPALDERRRLSVRLAGAIPGRPALSLECEDDQDLIQLVDAVRKLTELRLQRGFWEERRASAGSPSRPWGNRRAWNAVQTHLDRVTIQRLHFANDCNHAWARRIATRAAYWRTGAVDLVLPADRLLGGHTWPWDQLQNFLRYKLREAGATLTVSQESPVEEPADALAP